MWCVILANRKNSTRASYFLRVSNILIKKSYLPSFIFFCYSFWFLNKSQVTEVRLFTSSVFSGECREALFQCGGTCLPLHLRCDGDYHCPDGEDEANCSKYGDNTPVLERGEETPHDNYCLASQWLRQQ